MSSKKKETETNETEEPLYPYDELMPFDAYWKLFKWFTRKMFFFTLIWAPITVIIHPRIKDDIDGPILSRIIMIFGPAFLCYMMLAGFMLIAFKTHAYYAARFKMKFKDLWLFILAVIICLLFLNSFNIAVWISDTFY